MKPSTAVELIGFGCLVAAAFMWQTVAGLIAAGVVCLLVGMSLEDDQVALAASKLVRPVQSAWRRRHNKREARTA